MGILYNGLYTVGFVVLMDLPYDVFVFKQQYECKCVCVCIRTFAVLQALLSPIPFYEVCTDSIFIQLL